MDTYSNWQLRRSKLAWLLRQLLPLQYRTHYWIDQGCSYERHYTTWRMWFGRCFAVSDQTLP